MQGSRLDIETKEWTSRKKALEAAGARLYEVSTENGKVILFILCHPVDYLDIRVGLLSVSASLQKLHELNINSIMVEGGATVIGTFLTTAQSTDTSVIDTIIVTIAPTFVGGGGTTYGIEEVTIIATFH